VNEKVDCVKAEVAQGMADAKINTELALGLSEHDGCVADTSGNYSNVDYPWIWVPEWSGERSHAARRVE